METLKEKLEEFGIKYIQNLDEFTEKILDFSNIEKAKQEKQQAEIFQINLKSKQIVSLLLFLITMILTKLMLSIL